MFSRAEDSELNNFKITAENGSVMERVSEYKYLGVWIYEKCSFKYHISKLVVKLRQIIGFLYRNRASFPLFCRQRIVDAVFLSVLHHGDVIYLHAVSTTLFTLSTIQPSGLLLVIATTLIAVYHTARLCGLLLKRGTKSRYVRLKHYLIIT